MAFVRVRDTAATSKWRPNANLVPLPSVVLMSKTLRQTLRQSLQSQKSNLHFETRSFGHQRISASGVCHSKRWVLMTRCAQTEWLLHIFNMNCLRSMVDSCFLPPCSCIPMAHTHIAFERPGAGTRSGICRIDSGCLLIYHICKQDTA